MAETAEATVGGKPGGHVRPRASSSSKRGVAVGSRGEVVDERLDWEVEFDLDGVCPLVLVVGVKSASSSEANCTPSPWLMADRLLWTDPFWFWRLSDDFLPLPAPVVDGPLPIPVVGGGAEALVVGWAAGDEGAGANPTLIELGEALSRAIS